MSRDYRIFTASLFFVLGFSVVFSLVGVLLQSLFAAIAPTAQVWLGRIGGIIIILFGLVLTGLVHPQFLSREFKFHAKHLPSVYLTSFVFGAAFAVGWTPCVGPVLGAVLTLAATAPSQAFLLMLAYTLGLGLPFLLVGFFTNEAAHWIRTHGKFLEVVQKAFGVVLIALGILVFAGKLGMIANFEFLTNLVIGWDIGLSVGHTLNIGIAFLAGIVSFLSPCVLPLLPAFLAFLAGAGMGKR